MTGAVTDAVDMRNTVSHEATCGDLPLDDGDECENLLVPSHDA